MVDKLGKITAKKPFTFIDIFSGIGGFRLALNHLGGKCLFSCEINKSCQNIYKENFEEIPFGDIELINPTDVPSSDILCAGFPCQPFSISGKKRGLEDNRSNVIKHLFDIIKLSTPKVIFLENVKFLVHHNQGKTLKYLINNLENIGYITSYEVLNAKDFGVPQNRERLIIIGSLCKKFNFDEIKKDNPVKIRDILDVNGNFEYLSSDQYTIIKNPLRQKSGLIFCGYRNKKIRTKGVRNATEHLSRVHKQPNRIYSIDGTHPTLSSQETSGRYWILLDSGEVRKLTITECFKLMGFPKKYKLSSSSSDLYRQIGNAVCVPMIRIIGKSILKQLM